MTLVTREQAFALIGHHLANLQPLAPALASVVLVGSLSNGSFTGRPGSDIDLVHILRDGGNARRAVLDAIARTEGESNRLLPFARCVYDRSQLKRPYPRDFPLTAEHKDLLELPVEILRMKESGRVLWGEDLLEWIDAPTREDLRAMQARARAFEQAVLAADPAFAQRRADALRNPTPRLMAQIVLTNAMLHYYFATGQSCSDKSAVAARMLRDVPAYRFHELLALAAKCRESPEGFTPADKKSMRGQFKIWQEEPRP
ncbi:MAG: nucleotidyltransferase domain-containing protein [Oscillospiraceae bacterium]|jgi:predicted nucleotidyltransferase|nr:nucleotidyltransferase domain-containing protein [Oscillospiraceae bacterium]